MKFMITIECSCGNHKAYKLNSDESLFIGTLKISETINDNLFHVTRDNEGIDVFCKKCARHVDVE